MASTWMPCSRSTQTASWLSSPPEKRERALFFPDYGGGANEHEDGVELAFGEPADEELAVVGLAEEFHADAGDGVEHEDAGAHRAGALAPRGAAQQQHEGEDEKAFAAGLVELRGVARQQLAGFDQFFNHWKVVLAIVQPELLREDHPPPHGGDAPPQLAVDKVGQPPEGDAERAGAGHVVGQVPEGMPVLFRVP